MKILIIGGTKFLGRHLIDAALRNNHEVKLFNRGRYSQEKFERVEQIYGNRNSDLDKLSGRNWDAVIDTCGYLPQTVKASAEFLRDNINQYVFISTGSVYADISKPDYNENTRLTKLSKKQAKEAAKIDPNGELTGATLGEFYGPLKVLCERQVEAAMPGRVLTVRSGLIVGEFDPTDRFTYWVMRVAGGGEVLVPGNAERFVQFIDARDLSEWVIKMIEQNETGIYNLTGNPFELTFGKLLEEIKAVSKSDARFTWVSEEFLDRETVVPWSELPLYLPESDSEVQGFLSANIDKALAKGLSFRPLRKTIRETLKWRKKKKDDLKAGISAEKEKELLGKWHEPE